MVQTHSLLITNHFRLQDGVVRHAYYCILPTTLIDLLSYDGRRWFNFYPFGEAVNSEDQELHLPFC